MNSLVFVLVRSAKNSLLEILRKPAKLALWIFIVVMIGGFFILSLFTGQKADSFQDIIWLKGLLFGFILIFVIIAVKKGLSNGDVIFDMNDVNLLFVSPVNPRLILLYGIIRMAKMAFWTGFFILFQSQSLGTNFGLGFDGILLVFLGFILAVGLLQVISLLIYSLTNGKPARKMAVRMMAVAAFLPLAAYLAVRFAESGNILTALESALRSPVSSWTPVAGWAAECAVALISGNLGSGLLFFGMILLTGALFMVYIALSNPDYYEDVLVASETAFEKKRLLSESQVNTEAHSTKKIRLTQTGISGWGANTLFYKHLRESFRANRLGLWGGTSFFIAGGAVLASFLLRNSGMLVLLQILMWIQIYLIGTGRGLRELYMHYLYLIPEDSFTKIIWSNLEIVLKVLVESLFVFTLSGLIMREDPLLVAAVIIVYTLFSFLLLGINYLFLRWTGADISEGILILIYTLAVGLIMLPGLVAAIVIANFLGEGGILIGLTTLALWELLAGLVCFAWSKGILHRCDMPVLKAGKQ
ncbi:MAG: putative ABC exporter domain-containing protein [Clostridia bacterium]|jgi:hypothetical protein|nr:putative ABC exporter domain-containing protein [Clostridia bacterium]